MRREAGFTLVELMVSLVAASILVTLAITVTASVTSTSQAQRDVSDVSQQLRAAAALVASDVRNAGYMMGNLDVGGVSYRPVSVLEAVDPTVTDGANSADEIKLLASDDSINATITGPSFHASDDAVSNVTGFTAGMLSVVVNKSCGGSAQACLVQITLVQGAAGHLQHKPGGTAGVNQPSNANCNNLSACWTGATFLNFYAHSYRIGPPATYPQGMLQMSPSGGFVANDWVNLAPGFVDLQVALCVDTNLNGLCDAGEWVNSGAALTNPPLPATPTTGGIMAVRVTLVARTFGQVSDWTQGQQPAAEDHTPPAFAGTTNAKYLYRAFTETLELRNGPM